MSNSNNQIKDIYNIPGVEDLSHDTAANIQGGRDYAMTLYRHVDLKDVLGQFDGGGLRKLSSNADNQASSVRITEGKWKFYTRSNWVDLPFSNDTVTLGKGDWNLNGFNDSISSFRRIS